MSLHEVAPANCRYTQIGKYQILSHVATGGMGVVYRALDPSNGQEVALKVVPPDVANRPALLERFRREAAHGLGLRHENLVAVCDFGESEGTFFLAMEWVEGTDLHQHILRSGPLDPQEACEVLFQIARALEHTSQAGIIHRDLKPANILLTQQAGRRVAKLTDLGLALQLSDEEWRLTRDGSTVGTVDYLAPEQARDSRGVDVRSDIYSLGCTCYYMLTGMPPFPEGTLTERAVKHARTKPADVRALNTRVSAGLAAILEKMLAKRPEDRYQTPRDLLKDLNWEMTGVEYEAGDARPGKGIPYGMEAAARETALDLSEGSVPELCNAPDGTGVLEGSALKHFDRASQFLAGGNVRAALPLLKACCRLEGGNLTFRQALRQAHKSRRETAHLPSWFLRLRALPDRIRLWLARRAGNSARVLECGEQILAWAPASLVTPLSMAEAAEEIGLAELARWLLEEALKEDRSGKVIRRALADFHERHANLGQAIVVWQSLSHADPGNRELPRKLNDLLAQEAIERTLRETAHRPWRQG